MANQIIRILTNAGVGMSTADILADMERPAANLSDTLARMRRNGLVQQDYLGLWRLQPEAAR